MWQPESSRLLQGTGKTASAWVVRAAAWYTIDCEDHPGIALGRQVISQQTKLETCVPMHKYYSKPNPHTNTQGRQNSTGQKYVRLSQRP